MSHEYWQIASGSDQRDFSWDRPEVEQFFFDIINSFESNDQEYFIGLITIHRPESEVNNILDGQQRLVTTTAIFSAIHHWFKSNGRDEDANLIATKFIQVRALGGEIITRLKLNCTMLYLNRS